MVSLAERLRTGLKDVNNLINCHRNMESSLSRFWDQVLHWDKVSMCYSTGCPDLTLDTRLPLNSLRCVWLYLPRAGINGVYHHCMVYMWTFIVFCFAEVVEMEVMSSEHSRNTTISTQSFQMWQVRTNHNLGSKNSHDFSSDHSLLCLLACLFVKFRQACNFSSLKWYQDYQRAPSCPTLPFRLSTTEKGMLLKTWSVM